jgi:hypothetical protein
VPELEGVSLIQTGRTLSDKILHSNLFSKKCSATHCQASAQGLLLLHSSLGGQDPEK